MNKLIILLIITSTSLLAKDNLFDNMDENTAISTGIVKLSSEEKIALIKWIESTQKQTKQQMEKQVRQEVTEQINQEVREEIKNEVTEEVLKKERKKFMGFTMKESDRETIESSIVGEVKEWNGRSVITLANGQVWKQTDKKVTRFVKKINPKITIKPKSFNSWSLYIEGSNRSIKVKRIK